MTATISRLWYSLLLIWASKTLALRGLDLNITAIPAGAAKGLATLVAIAYLVIAIGCLGWGIVQVTKWACAALEEYGW